jgi:hypothetical protein
MRAEQLVKEREAERVHHDAKHGILPVTTADLRGRILLRVQLDTRVVFQRSRVLPRALASDRTEAFDYRDRLHLVNFQP